ncbi:type 1 glutamine amidotransferase [Pseudidiomarina tainanensis]|jgi:anthranilate synthase/aminodeoxychorismate synthase-like glutamine amidotransferase|uniref:Para-aminobenzoate synthetase component 2 n=2 Tax=Pseudidiomarina TaxID=2800384 RepID=A0A1I6H4D9_9GAMM|nr:MULTISPECIES: aminodeoxychorismate/anthranilate synthase component II [Pseudidiomarina]RZQ55483.1 type 1 glutamine amidotransferase [Pseudidiomarina tainanensis]SFR49324.1 para-aminobenzoate synthetase component 2 [Pseudidiomarina maritima]
MLLMIDNYDSFTHNVVRYFRELNATVKVVRNDQISLAEIQQLPLSGIVISPGPCTPNEAGISLAVIEKFAGQIPLLGVCLGHQAIGQVFGAQVVRARQVMHGKTSELHHHNLGLFQGLPSPFKVARYHSLVLANEHLPEELLVDAWVTNSAGEREIMAIRHADLPVWGVQYHPEAIETEHGHAIFQRFLEFCQPT